MKGKKALLLIVFCLGCLPLNPAMAENDEKEIQDGWNSITVLEGYETKGRDVTEIDDRFWKDYENDLNELPKEERDRIVLFITNQMENLSMDGDAIIQIPIIRQDEQNHDDGQNQVVQNHPFSGLTGGVFIDRKTGNRIQIRHLARKYGAAPLLLVRVFNAHGELVRENIINFVPEETLKWLVKSKIRIPGVAVAGAVAGGVVVGVLSGSGLIAVAGGVAVGLVMGKTHRKKYEKRLRHLLYPEESSGEVRRISHRKFVNILRILTPRRQIESRRPR